jgi:hypothetical protein
MKKAILTAAFLTLAAASTMASGVSPVPPPPPTPPPPLNCTLLQILLLQCQTPPSK